MSEWLTRALNQSEEKGEDVLSEALDDLFEQGRDVEARRAMKDKQFRAQILEEFRAKRAEATA